MAGFLQDGYFHLDHLAFGEPAEGAILSRGYAATLPDLGACDPSTQLGVERDFGTILSYLGPDDRLQGIFHTSSEEFEAPLRGFHERTALYRPPTFALEARRELYERFFDRMRRQRLIQGNARFFFSCRLQPFQARHGRPLKAFDEVFEVKRAAFENRAASIHQLLSAYGGGLEPMDDQAHRLEFTRFFSPANARLLPRKPFDCRRTIYDLCRFSRTSPRAVDHGFYADGHYFGVLVFKTFPPETGLDSLFPLLGLAIPGLRVTLNVEPIPLDAELAYQKKRHETLEANPDDVIARIGKEKHESQIASLLSNATRPFRAQLIVTVHSRKPEELDERLEAVRTAIITAGAEPYEPAEPPSALSYYACAVPGIGPWVDYRDYWHRIHLQNLAHLLPAASTPKGELDRAHLIFDGAANNLVGLVNFIESQPVPTLVIGPTGSGKSFTIQTVLTQSAGYVRYLVVIDYKRSYEACVRKLDPTCRPIIIQAGGSLTFNLFHLPGLPLTPEHLTDATALAHLVVGSTGDAYQDEIARSVLLEHIRKVYTNAYTQWRKSRPKAHLAVCREALTLLRFRAACLKPDAPLIEAFVEARTRRRQDPAALAAFEAPAPAEQALGLSYDPQTEAWVRDLAFSTWAPEDFPQLFNLYDELRASGNQKSEGAQLCGDLARLLRGWTARHGMWGALLDGVNNVDLGSTDVRPTDPFKVIYFDLGELKEAQAKLRSVVSFLIANQVANHLMGMSPAIRKQMVMEELTGFLECPNAEEIAAGYFERMRKHGCQLFAVFQQWQSILHKYPRAAQAMIGNCLALMLMRNNRDDLEALAKFRYIPPAVMDQVTAFPMPETMRGRDDAFAGFAHLLYTGKEPQVTIGKNVVSEELEKVFTSSSDEFEERQRRMKEELEGDSKAA